MATIQRSLLIEAPVQVSYRFWSDHDRPRGLLHGLFSANGQIPVPGVPAHPELVEEMPDRLLRWRCAAPVECEALLTFAPLEGHATWFTFTLEYAPARQAEEPTRPLTDLTETIDRELRACRDAIEAEASGRGEPRATPV